MCPGWQLILTLCPHVQLIPLCIQHRLFAALIHIFTRALQDHQTPAALLLVAAAAAGEAECDAGAGEPASADMAPDQLLQRHESLRLGYKLLLFLRCCLLGYSYPAGKCRCCFAGDRVILHFPSRPMAPCQLVSPWCTPAGTGRASPEIQQRSKAQALAFLLYSTTESGASARSCCARICCISGLCAALLNSASSMLVFNGPAHTDAPLPFWCSVGLLAAVG